jgi:RNA polymerase sigma factor (TIGR02999 family)
MTSQTPSELTELLNLGLGGNTEAADRAFAMVYNELRRAAAQQLRFGHESPTWSPTSLVNEAYLKLISGAQLPLNDRAHFFSLSACAMRQLLIDRQRAKQAEKHGGELQRVELNDDLLDESAHEVDYLDLDRALKALQRIDERAARVVDLHFFAGLNFMEIAELLVVSDKTVRRDWNSARAFLLVQTSS